MPKKRLLTPSSSEVTTKKKKKLLTRSSSSATARIQEIVKRRVNYLMRSSVCKRSLRSGTQRKECRTPKYLSIFKNKRQISRPEPKSEPKPDNVQLLKVVKREMEHTEKELAKHKLVDVPKCALKVEEKPVEPPTVVEVKPPAILETPKELIKEKLKLDSPVSPLPQAPDSTVNLRYSIDGAAEKSASPSVITTTYADLNTLKNPLDATDGEIMHLYSIDELLIVVQVGRISYWRYSAFKHLIGAEQTYELIGRCRRHNESGEYYDPT